METTATRSTLRIPLLAGTGSSGKDTAATMGKQSARAAHAAAVVAALAGVAVGACSDQSGPRAVFQMTDPQTRAFGSVNIGALTDIGVPLYANITDKPVRLRSIRLVGLPPAVHVIGVRA